MKEVRPAEMLQVVEVRPTRPAEVLPVVEVQPNRLMEVALAEAAVPLTDVKVLTRILVAKIRLKKPRMLNK